ncbi:MAG: hypothetical protein MZV65_31820 [Chromatiales bacterium]|nr:hypothetical protein [Chromatiales bacterium]
MSKSLKPWSEGWIEAVEREKDTLESLSATALIAAYGETDAMLIDEVVADVTFDRHTGPWIDCEHEEACWKPLFAETAALSLCDLKRRVSANTRRLIDVWVMDRAEKNVRKEAQIRAQEETDYRVFLHELWQAA